MRIAVKLFLSFLVVVVLPLGLLAVTSTSLIDERMHALAQEAVAEDLKAAWIQFYVRGDQMKFGMLQAAAVSQHQDAIAIGDEKYLRNLLGAFRRERPYVDIWAVTDVEGRVIAKLGDKPIGDEALKGVVLRALLLREPEVKVELLSAEVIEAYGDGVLVSKLSSLGLNEGMALVAVVPVSKGNELEGTIVTADLLVEDFFVVDELAKRFPEAVFLIAQGDIAISTNAREDDKRVLGIRLHQDLMEEVKAGKTPRMVETVGDRNYISTSEPIKDSLGNVLGVLFVGVPEEKYLALGRENAKRISIAFLLALLVALGIASIAVREISNPLNALVEATKKMKGGEFQVAVEDKRLESKDEFGELARTFSDMGRELKGLYEGLEQKVRERTEVLEISNEELQVANEELQVANEELKLTTEDLQNREKELKESLEREKELKAKVEEYSKTLEDKVMERTRELRESEEYLKTMFDSVNEAIFTLDLDRRFVFCNRAAEKMFGYSLEEVAGKSTEMFHVDRGAYEEFGRRLYPVIKETGYFAGEYKLKRKNGEIFPVEHTVSTIKDEKGKPTGLVGVITDITERKKAEEHIRELSQFPERNPNPIFKIGKTGEVLYNNPGVFNYVKDAKKVRELLPSNYKKIVSEACESGREARAEHIYGDRYIDYVFWPVSSEAAHVYGRDITVRKKYEEELKKRIAELERMHRLMVGRELRMKELKKKIEELEDRAA